MYDYTEDFNGMLKRMFLGCDPFAAEIALVAGFKNPYDSLQVISGDIERLGNKQKVKISDGPVLRPINKHTFYGLAGDIASITLGYAYAINDAALIANMDWKPNYSYTITDEEVIRDCKKIYDNAIGHKAALLNYGITAANFNDLGNMVVDWEVNMETNLEAWKLKRMHSAQMLAKVKEGKLIVENILDKVIVAFKTSCPEMYKAYSTSRSSMSSHSMRRANSGTIIGFVYVKEDGIPLNALVWTTAGTVMKRVESDMDGMFRNVLPVGTYTFTCEKQGYVTLKAENILIRNDEDRLLNFEMYKLGTKPKE